MANELRGKKIAFVAADGVEEVELTEPWNAVEQASAEPELLSVKSGEIQAFNHLDKGGTFKVDKVVSEADPTDYDGLVLPGGVANPDFLRTDENAGGKWVDKEVVVDSGLVSSRKPDDLPAFCAKIVEEFAEGEHAEQREKTAAAARS